MHVPFLWTVIARTRRSSRSILHLFFPFFLHLSRNVCLASTHWIRVDGVIWFCSISSCYPLESPFNPLGARLSLPTLRSVHDGDFFSLLSTPLFLFVLYSTLSSRVLHGHNVTTTLTPMVVYRWCFIPGNMLHNLSLYSGGYLKFHRF